VHVLSGKDPGDLRITWVYFKIGGLNMTYIKDIHITSDSEFIECQICKQKLTKIDGRHTKVHKISFIDYKKQFPDTPTITMCQLNKELLSIKIRQDKKDNNKTKIIKCCNPNCNQEFEGNINYSNKYTLCPKCKKTGIVNLKDKEKYDKLKTGMFKKYGNENASNVKSIVEQKQVNLKNKIEQNPDYFERIVNKRKDTMKQKYGEDYTLIINKKSQQALLEKYGYKHVLQNPDSIKKFKDTYFKQTGYETPFDNPDIIKEIKQTNLKKYGVENVMQDPDISKRASKSLKESWKDPKVIKIREQAYINNFIPRLLLFLKENANIKILEEYQNAFFRHEWECLKCNYKFKQNWNAIQQGYLCPNCRPNDKDKSLTAESKLASFIESLNIDIVRNNRELIKPYELDIMIPSKKIAVEYCGLFWHTEKILKDTRKKINDVTKYHLYKFQQCQEKDYKLITIFEDEWLFKKDIVKSRLKHIFGVDKSIRIHTRKCEIFELTSLAKNEFLDKFHIQGKDNSSIKLGAFYENILVAIMTFSKGNIAKGSKIESGKWELNRFCSDSNYHAPGIASKLLTHFKRNYEWNEIFSYADQRWSDGNLYYKLGFKLQHITQPNYWYVDINKIKRLHRFGLRKRPDEPKNITERTLRISEGYQVIWDCGNLKFNLTK